MTRNKKDLPGTLASKFAFTFKCLTRRLPHREAIESTVTFIFLQHFTSWSRIVASFATVEIFLGIWCLEISMSLQKTTSARVSLVPGSFSEMRKILICCL